uniref:Uncharacterized protein n=1 Tax=Babesia bovis TaxID=5865 RepID=S6BEA6_BABBO|nr:hypothetical protein [Babesia bovis]
MSDRASLLVYGMFGVTVRANEGLSDKTSKLSEGDLVEVDVTDVKVLQKNKWVMMSTTMDRINVIS